MPKMAVQMIQDIQIFMPHIYLDNVLVIDLSFLQCLVNLLLLYFLIRIDFRGQKQQLRSLLARTIQVSVSVQVNDLL